MKSRKASSLSEYDSADYLQSPEDLAAYLNAILEEKDSGLLAHALGVVARAQGMPKVSAASGIQREALYKALRADAMPRFSTIQQVAGAMGLRLKVEPYPALRVAKRAAGHAAAIKPRCKSTAKGKKPFILD
jgi:probable addiction module antidote protein